MNWFYLYAHVWDPPRGLGDRRTRSFISGELGNKSLKLRGNRETRRFWGTGNIGNKYFDFRVFAVRLKKAWVLSLPLIAQRRLWSDWADTQADLSLHWAHSHFVVFFFSCRGSNCFVLLFPKIIYFRGTREQVLPERGKNIHSKTLPCFLREPSQNVFILISLWYLFFDKVLSLGKS